MTRPMQVAWTGIQQVSAGYNHTVGLKSDGTVVAVGSNEYNESNLFDWNLYGEKTDSDGDGILDRVEAPYGLNRLDRDTDDDGLADGIEDANRNGVVDAGETNPCNPDTDGDGIQDGTEKGITGPVADPDGTGPLAGTNTAVFVPGADPLSKTDPLKPDTDGDG